MVLPSNLLTGEMPSLTGLQQLNILSLSGNRLSGDLLLSEKVQIVNIGSNDYRTVPPGLRVCSELKNLTLSSNDIGQNLPLWLYNLTSLEVLNMYAVGMRRVDSELSQLTNLQVLNIGFNPLGGLPSGLFSKLSKLEELLLGSLELWSLPVDIANLNLTTLSLSGNIFRSVSDFVFQEVSGSGEKQLLHSSSLSNHFRTPQRGQPYHNTRALRALVASTPRSPRPASSPSSKINTWFRPVL